jgi:hypothetical protein
VSIYSGVDRRINGDAWFCGLGHDAQLVFLRLLTGSHVTPVAGLWAARESGLAEDFRFTIKAFRAVFAEITREPASNGLPRAVADWKAGVLWLPNAIKQDCNQPNNWKTLQGWFKYLEMVPECEVTAQALRQFGSWVDGNRSRFNIAKGTANPFLDGLVNSWRNGIGYRHTRASRDQEQDRDREKKQEQEPSGGAAPAAAPTPIRLPMHAAWRPVAGVLESFRVGLIPDWAFDQLIARFRTHFCANPQDIRTEAEWNQACSKWVFRDWGNPSRRPTKPIDTAPVAPTETFAAAAAAQQLRETYGESA